MGKRFQYYLNDSITKIEDFALVFSIQEKKFSIVSIFSIHSNNGQINEGEEYDISFGKGIYSGLIKCLVSQGNEIVLEVKKSREIRATSESQHHDETLKNSRKYKKNFIMSEIFQKLFKPNANDKTLVTLSNEYPNFFVKPLATSSVLSLIESWLSLHAEGITLFVPETLSWISKTAKQFKRDFANIINPVFDMISKQDSNFNVTALNSTLNSIIQDLKKKLKLILNFIDWETPSDLKSQKEHFNFPDLFEKE
ncbi:hypothetical protein BpHYR1_030678 [Brachionus plicatilis]|uniref:Uncharacterized protein n=1 Tax=Brachionus plicatilis TaxID=10195 RepID=A0A3M7R7U2_BRAPC|nr:hypothetical protein BpHYR1_030678 [Brachionus plicatilis]